MRKERGYTLIELAVSGTLLAALMGAAAIAVARDTQTTRVIMAPVAPELKGHEVLERIASELRMAGEWGEDLDRDGILDDGEDSNTNGNLDADWDLADGAVDQTTLSFNRRIDLLGAGGIVEATGVYSRRVTYRLEADRLVREWLYTNGGGATLTRRSVLSHDIGGLRFSRTGSLVTISLDVLLPENTYKTDRRTLTTQIWLRN